MTALGTAPAPNPISPYADEGLDGFIERLAKTNHIPSGAALKRELGLRRRGRVFSADEALLISHYAHLDLEIVGAMNVALPAPLLGPVGTCSECAKDGRRRRRLFEFRCVEVCPEHDVRLNDEITAAVSEAERIGAGALSQRLIGFNAPLPDRLPAALASLDAAALATLVMTLQDNGRGASGDGQSSQANAEPCYGEAWSLVATFPTGLHDLWGARLEAAIQSGNAQSTIAEIRDRWKRCRVAQVKHLLDQTLLSCIADRWIGPMTALDRRQLPAYAHGPLRAVFRPGPMTDRFIQPSLRRQLSDACRRIRHNVAAGAHQSQHRLQTAGGLAQLSMDV
ncbi:MAG: hypothetical protein K2P80_14510 [Beijerinckiaceae bacterium]|nr:hypothetical protein [Beijerinckiaceae bacterium]